MATFRIHLSTDQNVSPVTNLITGIGELRDETDNATAESLLCKLESEIAFVRQFILDIPARSIPNRTYWVTPNTGPEGIAPSKRYTPKSKPTDIRKPASGTAIHP